MSEIEELQADHSVLLDKITDVLEDEIIDEDTAIEDILSTMEKLENLQMQFRLVHAKLKLKMVNYDEIYKSVIIINQNIRIFLKNAREKKSTIRKSIRAAQTEQLQSKNLTSDFLINETRRAIDRLQDIVCVSLSHLDDAEVKTRQEELPGVIQSGENLSLKYNDMLKLVPSIDADTLEVLSQIEDQFVDVMEKLQEYHQSLKQEVSSREFDKKASFNIANLNIKIAPFKGYESSQDIYTFQTTFEKLYLHNTPTNMLPDLLKNNLLEDPAAALVKNISTIEDIWTRLKLAYGDPKLMLSKKLKTITREAQLWKLDGEKLIEGISKITNLMRDLMKLAGDHHIEAKLYNGGGLEKVYYLMGDSRVTRWIGKSCDGDLEDQDLWNGVIEFLEKEIRVTQKKLAIYGGVVKRSDDSKPSRSSNYHAESCEQTSSEESRRKDPPADSPGRDQPAQKFIKKCIICGASDHKQTTGPNGAITQYFSCKKFVDMTPAQRFRELMNKRMCVQCLFPGAEHNKGKHKDGSCQAEFTCKHGDHTKFRKKKHVLLCEDHKSTEENKKLLEEYRNKCISKRHNLEQFSYDIQLYHTSAMSSNTISNPTAEKAIYLLQNISINSKTFTIFYDTGCSDFVCKREAVESLPEEKAILEYSGVMKIGGVGNLTAESNNGVYKIKLPLHNGNDAVLSGTCMDEITKKFPNYPLQGRVADDIQLAYTTSGGNSRHLPKLPSSVGGSTDFMIGIKYLCYYPEEIFKLPSGLTIYKSAFKNVDGSRGVVGGPHEIFTQIEHAFYNCHHQQMFYSEQYNMFRNGYKVDLDCSVLHIKEPKDCKQELLLNIEQHPDVFSDVMLTRSEKLLNEVENAGSEITYRCMRCRDCKDCKNHERIEAVSIKEEVEQDLIDQSVTVDLANRQTIAKLPLLSNPITKITNNKPTALAVFNQQLKKLSKNPKDKADVIESQNKLQSLGHVDYTQNLSHETQIKLKQSNLKYYIPWRAVWKSNSVSTPCRVVFDASQPTSTGVSLNELLPKGRNNMNKLVEIVIRWMTHHVAVHTDVQKMYNSVKLREEDWTYQRYIWQDELDPSKEPVEKVIKTLIYGVKSSGNQAERGLRETARLSQEEYPEVYDVIRNDVYVDDCLSGECTKKDALNRADQIDIVLNRGGFTLKGFTFSGKTPSDKLSDDGESISVAGMKWYSKEDKLSLDIGELNFAKKNRGKKPEGNSSIPKKLTRRHCVAKVAEIFDLVGKVTPVVAGMKLDLHTLVTRSLSWDDEIPNDLRPVWENHFQMMQELKHIRFKRAVVPDDAVSLDIETIDTGDASKSIVCIAIYARFLKRDGTYSCQLIFSRSKLVPENMSLPRAELFAATINAHTGEVVKRALSKFHKHSTKLTDSQITLHWINCNDKPLKMWVRNRVLEIRRFSDKNNWFYIQSHNMIADLGTRKGVSIHQINQNSSWINGLEWMKLPKEQFPTKSAKGIILETQQQSEILKEATTDVFIPFKSFYAQKITGQNASQVLERLEFSNYIINPMHYTFPKFTQIVTICLTFIHKLKKRINKQILVTNADQYIFTKTSHEVKKFIKEDSYSKLAIEQNGILKYSGRILPTHEIDVVGNISNIAKDLCATSFCVPVLDRHSPIAHSIATYVHWNDPVAKHRGIETLWRYTLMRCYIINGRELVKQIKRSCHRCRYLSHKLLEVSMGPVSEANLKIAPAFYCTQVDIAGPLKSFSLVNKRTTIKIWLLVFCCTTTSSVSIKVMEDYSTTGFIQAFTRFSCDFGYPKLLLIDEGGQLKKGCQEMLISFTDIKAKLHRDKQIEFSTCPVGAHNVHGKVERRIREIRESIARTSHNERLSTLQWETLVTQIANATNDLPLALGNVVADFENMDLLTPNRLRLGHNNCQSPSGPLTLTNKPSRILKENEKVFQTWFDCWILNHVPKLMHQPKWFRSDRDVAVGDIVLFTKQDSALSNTYNYARVAETNKDADGRIRRVKLEYQNADETVKRETVRSIRDLTMIHPADETTLHEEIELLRQQTRKAVAGV